MNNQTNYVNEVNNVLAQYSIYPEFVKKFSDSIIAIRLDGDWKHTHACAKYAINEKFDCDIRCISVDDSDGDWYAANYVVIIQGVKN